MKNLYEQIATARLARRALKAKVQSLFKRKITGAVIWEGASPQDGKPICAIVTGLDKATRNDKTGDMLQIWIIRTDITPYEAVKTGEDKSVCGNCTHRRGHGGLKDCYVLPHQAPTTIFRNYKAGKYPVLTLKDFDLFKGMMVRLGAYGDPAFIPLAILTIITDKAAGYTGYTHQAQNPAIHDVKKYAKYLHASADSPKHARILQSKGWRTFETRYDSDTSGQLCAAEDKGLSCELCLECNGTSGKNIYIQAHGSQSKKHIK